jgi:NAD(P)H-dependent FMN reductase
MKILGFAGSNSATSINKALVKYVLSKAVEHQTELIDLNDFEVAIFSPEREAKNGIPALVVVLADKIREADVVVLSLAEHNGSYSAAFKNLYDWMSRIPNQKVWLDTKMVLMATSPGARGGQSVLEAAGSRFPRDGAEILGTFSLPSFFENFDETQGITNLEYAEKLQKVISPLLD